MNNHFDLFLFALFLKCCDNVFKSKELILYVVCSFILFRIKNYFSNFNHLIKSKLCCIDIILCVYHEWFLHYDVWTDFFFIFMSYQGTNYMLEVVILDVLQTYMGWIILETGKQWFHMLFKHSVCCVDIMLNKYCLSHVTGNYTI